MGTYRKNSAATQRFSETMKSVWKEQMKSRLSFLLETSNAPSRVATPIVDFINALQLSDEEVTKKSKSLVDTIVAMDAEEGEAQAKEDEEWSQMATQGLSETNDYSVSMGARRVQQEKDSAEIARRHKAIEDINAEMNTNEVEIRSVGDATVRKTKECDIDYIEFDTIIEMAKEELVNVQRLNSLLR